METNRQENNMKEFVRLRFIVQDCDIGEVAQIISQNLKEGIFSVCGVKSNKKYHGNKEEEDIVFNETKNLRYVQVKMPLSGVEDVICVGSLHRAIELFIIKDLSDGPEIVRTTASK